MCTIVAHLMRLIIHTNTELMLQVKHKSGLPRLALLRAMLRRELVLFQVLNCPCDQHLAYLLTVETRSTSAIWCAYELTATCRAMTEGGRHLRVQVRTHHCACMSAQPHVLIAAY